MFLCFVIKIYSVLINYELIFVYLMFIIIVILSIINIIILVIYDAIILETLLSFRMINQIIMMF